MSLVRFVGDIHGDFGQYSCLVENADASVQIGDYGLGFNKGVDSEMKSWGGKNPQHKFIRGNHDNPQVAKTFPNYISDGSYYPQNQIMYIGGAWSIDYARRTEGRDWWFDEECSSQDFRSFYKTYTTFKPRTMVTHDAPLEIPELTGLLDPAYGGQVETRTGLYLQYMFNAHKPETWIFGHWHKSLDYTYKGTRFICLGINESLDWELEDHE